MGRDHVRRLIPDWSPMHFAPRDATWVEVERPDHNVVVAHWACGGGEEQPPFRGWFVRVCGCGVKCTCTDEYRRYGGFIGIEEPIAWRPIARTA